MSHTASSYVIKRRFGNPTRKLIMLLLADHADGTRFECWPSVDSLAAKAECSRRSVQDHLAALARDGEIEIIANAGREGTNIYRIIFKKFGPGEKGPEGVQNLHGGCKSAPPKQHGGGADQRRQSAHESVRNHQEPSGTSLPPTPSGGASERAAEADLIQKITTLRPQWGGARTLDARLRRKFAANAATFRAWTPDDWELLGKYLNARLDPGDASTQPRQLHLFLDCPSTTLGHARHWQSKQRPKTTPPALKVLPPPEEPPATADEIRQILARNS